MSVWRDEADFMQDIERISEFYISGNHNNPTNKFVFKSKRDSRLVNPPWYESDSEEELDFCAFGRGRNPVDKTKDPGGEPNHLEVMKEIQMQVRSAVGNRYNNDVLESYYNVCRNDPEPVDETPSKAPKEVSITYAKEQRTKNASSTAPKRSIAENIEQAASKLTITDNKSSTSDNKSTTTDNRSTTTDNRTNSSTAGTSSSTSSTSSSPKKENKHRGNSRKRYSSRNYRQSNTVENNVGFNFPFSSPKKEMNFNSKEDFPPL